MTLDSLGIYKMRRNEQDILFDLVFGSFKSKNETRKPIFGIYTAVWIVRAAIEH